MCLHWYCTVKFQFTTDDKPSLQTEAHLRWCQMTADCTIATTRRTNTAITATPTTAEVTPATTEVDAH